MLGIAVAQLGYTGSCRHFSSNVYTLYFYQHGSWKVLPLQQQEYQDLRELPACWLLLRSSSKGFNIDSILSITWGNRRNGGLT